MTDLCAFLQANIDDQNPEILSYVMDRLLEDGANHVFF
ncbi:nickel insertion protein [Cytobacillus firmus]